jgi:hypothetical protein
MSSSPNSTIKFYYQNGVEVIGLTNDAQHDQSLASSRAIRQCDWPNLIDLTSCTDETWVSSDCHIITQPAVFTDETKDESRVSTSEPVWGGIGATPKASPGQLKTPVIDTIKNVPQVYNVQSLASELQSIALVFIASTRSPAKRFSQIPVNADDNIFRIILAKVDSPKNL